MRTADGSPIEEPLADGARAPSSAVALLLVAVVWLAACARGSAEVPPNNAPTPATHSAFLISSGVHAVSCETCHDANSQSFADFKCLGCHAHDQSPTDRVHSVPIPAVLGTYSYGSKACYSCHRNDDGQIKSFSHTGITDSCTLCHAEGASFAALPRTGFNHQPIASTDCAACHATSSWKTSAVPGLVADPERAVILDAQLPVWSGTSIAAFTVVAEVLPMPMLHTSAQLGAAQSACSNCHTNANGGNFYPGAFHSSIVSQGLSQPSSCRECHLTSQPAGFVGPPGTKPPRNPASGEMKHDAVVWQQETKTTTAIVTQDCALCHVAPAAAVSRPWSVGVSGGVQFHASLAKAGAAQPASCNDCHANNRPTQLSSANASGLAPGLSYDHTISPSQADCVACHTAVANPLTSWAGGHYHHAGDSTPSTCLPCHAGERPSAAINPTSSWKTATYANSPFDYLTTATGGGSITHGNGNDCVACHGAGTGAWGGTQNWQSGNFPHGAGTDAASTCAACHSSQRPASPVAYTDASGNAATFDHAVNGSGDCFGCHQATVTAGRYITYSYPGGDWKGGQAYPGSTLIGSSLQFVSTTELTLLRTSASNPKLVTGVSKTTATLYDQFLHTSSAVPGVFGLSATPEPTVCWHCHTNDGSGKVTSFANGQFHPALDHFKATPTAAETPIAQPTSRCTDCHTQRPANIVEKPAGSPAAPSELQPMDHAAVFASTTTVGGIPATGAASFDCSTCHSHPGAAWTDGTFHKNIGAARPADCTVCHYSLMADATASGKVSANGTDFSMKHGSTQMAVQDCQACHTESLGAAATAPVAAASWSGAAFHAGVPAQPTACVDCHTVSTPQSATTSATVYTMPKGGSSSNGPQWLSHASPAVVGTDCATCHAADARASGSAWRKTDLFHPKVTPATCNVCHGLGNSSSTVGTNNNMPVGLTDSTTVSTAGNDPGTGVPAGTLDQIDHSDLNVVSQSCALCHRQLGLSTVAGVQGREWAQAAFHPNFTGAFQLVINGTTARCSNCHLNVVPRATFTGYNHAGLSRAPGTQDCVSCHVPGANWLGSLVPTTAVSDPAKSLALSALIPTWSGTSITSFASQSETLPMQMLHTSTAVSATAYAACSSCHVNISTNSYYPGALHPSLTDLKLPQPTGCVDCHAASAPTGFVGPIASNPTRSPSSGEMKHDAVAWNKDVKTATPLVTQDCKVCHLAPASGAVSPWRVGTTGTTVARYHASLSAALLAQPTSCNDCHANTRPGQLSSANAALQAGIAFDHTAAPAASDCLACHAGTSVATQFTSWSGGRFHRPGDATPGSCLPCHAGERPSATINPTGSWKSPTYASAPFDYLTNASNVTHGNGRDCVSCHSGPGTGAWGSTQSWVGGVFPHGATTDAASTCIACHISQRPTAPVSYTDPNGNPATFDHSANGTGDCFGCHQATVAAGKYVAYTADWKGGQGYPGSSLVGSASQSITLTELALQRASTSNPALVTGVVSSTATFNNQFLHTSTIVPSQFGLGANPNTLLCWHCHTHNPTTGAVTSFSNGVYHASLTSFTPALSGAVASIAQPLTQCADCHTQQPGNIVEPSGTASASELRPMDHSQSGRGSECSACHASPGATWSDGAFHKNVGSAIPADCTVCHYSLMADANAANKVSGTNFTMQHTSSTITSQNCQSCHTGALANGKATPVTSTLWSGGFFHSGLAAQPAACLDCHTGSRPAADTQSIVSYAFALGGTASNAAQWMNHSSANVTGDCSACHAADARPATNNVWSRSDSFHAVVTSPSSCQDCHGLTNRNGSTAGTGNNLPGAITDSSTLTTASSPASTGVPPGTHDQILHTDANVTSHDCNFCHTQAGVATLASGIQGKEWAQANFHSSFTAASPAVFNGSSGRCSNCHLNVKPTGSFTTFDHSAYTGTSATDCATCHKPPPAENDWLNASGYPTYIAVGGFNVAQPPATSVLLQGGLTNLPHPNNSSCASCHTGGIGGKKAIGYDHSSNVVNTKVNGCSSCHEAGSNLVGTVWNNAVTTAPPPPSTTSAGDTRPITLGAFDVSYSGNTCTITPSNTTGFPGAANHFYPIDCYECHATQAGIAVATTGTAYVFNNTQNSTGAWGFPHKTGNMASTTCNTCHTTCPKG